MSLVNGSVSLALSCHSSPDGGKGDHDVVQGVMESHGAGPCAPIRVLHLYQEVSEAGHDKYHYECLQTPADELRA